MSTTNLILLYFLTITSLYRKRLFHWNPDKLHNIVPGVKKRKRPIRESPEKYSEKTDFFSFTRTVVEAVYGLWGCNMQLIFLWSKSY